MRTRLVLLVALLFPALASADSVVLLPATGSNLHEGHLAAATDVLRGHLEQNGYTVIRGALPTPGAEPTPAQAGEAARAAGAPLAVTLRLARLGSSASVRLAAYGPDGTLRHSDELGAGRPDDLDAVLRRLAEGLATGKPARTLAQIDTVTAREADPYEKYSATNVFGIRLGGGLFLDRAPDGDTAPVAGAGIFWLYDARSYLADIGFDFLDGEDEDSLGAVTIGVYYPLSRGNVSPYVGGALSYAWSNGFTGHGNGLGARAAAGLLVGRLSTVQLRAELGFFSTLYDRDSAAGEDLDFGPVLSVGIGF